ncbi:hypothetical protein N8T08_007107 [Aspergillus melleus]|uniref:Uncharacterized protein n=1 Tax=Aspergillus melleus TaxID=138277 RepID=A0ACC3AZ58_9EURO|nr:hypothetical protein N8T08_007107 [Aspergillus melleus]
MGDLAWYLSMAGPGLSRTALVARIGYDRNGHDAGVWPRGRCSSAGELDVSDEEKIYGLEDKPLSPIFQRSATELVQMHGNEPFDPLPYLQKTVAEAIAVIIFGDEIARTCNPDLLVNIAEGVAKATGMFQNQSSWGRRFPTLYSFYSWTELILFHLIWRFGREMGPTVWTALSKLSNSPEDSKDADDTNSTVLAVVARKLASEPGHLSIASKIWAIILSLAFIFASVHQTVVIMTYVVFELARHPECQESIVLADLSSSSPLTVDSLRDAIHAESFIREVLRMKGEAITTVRSPRHDLELAGYSIPKGSLLQPMVYPSNRSPEYTTNPDTFDGMRWTQNRKLATTTGPGHLSFGLGRWACPGRFLAVAGFCVTIVAAVICYPASLFCGCCLTQKGKEYVSRPPFPVPEEQGLIFPSGDDGAKHEQLPGVSG